MNRKSKLNMRVVGSILVLSVLVLSLFGTTRAGSAQSQRTAVPNLDIVLVIDESGSMWNESDPPNATNQGWRIVMAKLFADLLGVDQSGSTHALSVIIFGAKAQIVSDLTLIQDSTSRQDLKTAIDAAHAATQNKNYVTNIPEALTQAYEELDTHGRPGAQKAVIFLSDGKCELADQTLNPQCNENIRQIIKDHYVGKYPVYTIAFTAKAYNAGDSAIYENLWQEIAADTGGEYFKPNKAKSDLLDVYIQILRHLFNLSSQTIPNPVQAPSKQVFNIPASQLQAVFTIVKYNENIKATIIRPDGSVVKVTDPDVRFSSSSQTDSYSFLKPAAGPWYVQLEGSGEVTVIYIPFPSNFLKVMRISPSGLTFPMGKPMDIIIQIADANGNLQSSLEDIKVDVTLPDGTIQTLTFSKGDKNTYQVQLKDTSQLGSYQLHFYGGHDPTKMDDTQTIAVIKAPWIRVLEPSPNIAYPFQKPLSIQAQMMNGMDPVTVPDPSDIVTVTAQLYDSNNNSIDFQQLKLENGVFSRQMQLDKAGLYALTVRIALIKASGEEYQDVSQLNVQEVEANTATPTIAPTVVPATPTPITPPPPPKPLPLGPIFGGLGGLIVLAGLGGLGWWWFNRPSLIGTLDSGGMQAAFPLSGRKPVYIGSDVNCKFNIQGPDILPKHAELRPIGSLKHPFVEIRSVDPAKPIKVDKIETIFQTLHDGNIITIGSFDYTYSGPPNPEDFEVDSSTSTLPPADKNDADSWKF